MRQPTQKFFILFVILCIAFIHTDGLAQQTNRISSYNRGSQYYLGSEDELLVPVNIWGFVKNPGQYMVPNNTDLISLLSFAGGPTEDAKISKIQIVRNDRKSGNQSYSINVKKYLDTADIRLIPTLKPGDTIVVRATTYHWITRFFEFVGRLSIIAQIMYFITLSQDRW